MAINHIQNYLPNPIPALPRAQIALALRGADMIYNVKKQVVFSEEIKMSITHNKSQKYCHSLQTREGAAKTNPGAYRAIFFFTLTLDN